MKSALRQCGPFSLLGGVAIGAGLMYLVDTHLHSRAHRAVTPISVVRRRPSVPDWVLAERARLEIWRTTANPDSIQISVREGCVTLWGPVLAEEPEKLREKLVKLPGLRKLDLQLTTQEEAAARVA
ncbi:MAG: hypothetical protein ACHP7P_01240 [Terriglobales bacterium]